MARVSLILPTTPERPSPVGRIPRLRQALEAEGHEVEVLLAGGHPEPNPDEDGWRPVPVAVPGPAAAAIAGLHEARGDVLLILDPDMGYQPDDLPRLVEPLADGRTRLLAITDSDGWRRTVLLRMTLYTTKAPAEAGA